MLHLPPPRTSAVHFVSGVRRLFLALALASVLHAADDSAKRQFDIPADTAEKSLKLFADQSGKGVLFVVDAVQGIQTNAVQGQFEPRDALDLLVSGTGLVVSLDEKSGAFAVKRTPPSPKAQGVAMEGAPPKKQETGDQEPEKLGEYVVTGTNIKRVDVEKVLPVEVMDADAMNLRDASEPANLLISLPQITNIPINESGNGAAQARGDDAEVDLRGIGSGNTLILLNGLRLAPHPIPDIENGVPTASVNVNQLPVTGIERVDVLLDGASSIYGADAVAGVVNFVTDMKFRGVELSTHFGFPSDGGAQDDRASIRIGADFAGGRGRWETTLDLYYREALYDSQRSISANTDRTALAANLGPFSGPTGGFFLSSSSGPYPSFHIGTSATTTFEVPAAGGGVAFQTTTPSRTGVTAPYYYNSNTYYDLFPQTARMNLFNRVEFDLNSKVTAFGEASYYYSQSLDRRDPYSYSSSILDATYLPLVLSVNNPYNPFGASFYDPNGAPNANGTARLVGTPQPITILTGRLMDMGPERIYITSDAARLLAGLRGKFLDSWNWDSSLYYTRATTEDVSQNAIRQSALVAAGARTDATAFNPFGYTFQVQNGAVVPLATYQNSSLVMGEMEDKFISKGVTSLGIENFHVSGDIFDSWSGPWSIASGGEVRRETLSYTRPPYDGLNPPGSGLNPNVNDIVGTSPKPDVFGTRTVGSVFGEVYLPIVAPRNDVVGVNSLDVSGAIRYEHFSDFGSATKPKFGVDMKPLPWILLRASYNEGFKAPNLAELHVSNVNLASSFADTYRLNATGDASDGTVNRSYTSGAAANLQPETSKEGTAGVVIDVPWAKGLSFNVDVWNIEQRNVIVADTQTAVLAADYADLVAYTQKELAAGVPLSQISFGEGTSSYKGDPRVTRSATISPADAAAFAAFDAKTPAGSQVGAFGPLTNLLLAYSNRENGVAEGADIGVTYHVPKTFLGVFSLSANWAYLTKSNVSLAGGGAVSERLNEDGQARWKGNTGVVWRSDPWTAGISAYYLGPYASTGVDTTAANYTGQSYIWKMYDNGVMNYYYKVESTQTFNGFISYHIGHRNIYLLRDTTLRFGVDNFTNVMPPLSATTFGSGFDTDVYNQLAIGRDYTVSLTKQF